MTWQFQDKALCLLENFLKDFYEEIKDTVYPDNYGEILRARDKLYSKLEDLIDTELEVEKVSQFNGLEEDYENLTYSFNDLKKEVQTLAEDLSMLVQNEAKKVFIEQKCKELYDLVTDWEY